MLQARLVQNRVRLLADYTGASWITASVSSSKAVTLLARPLLV